MIGCKFWHFRAHQIRFYPYLPTAINVVLALTNDWYGLVPKSDFYSARLDVLDGAFPDFRYTFYNNLDPGQWNIVQGSTTWAVLSWLVVFLVCYPVYTIFR